MAPHDLADLRRAKTLLQKPGWAARTTRLLSLPIAKGLALLPMRLSELLARISHAAIEKALTAAVITLRTDRPRPAGNRLHTLLVTVSGASAGAFGLPALALELPLSTAIMLRSIAAIARSEGLDLRDTRIRLECVQVLALGSPTPASPSSESGYFAVRTALARTVSEAAQHLARKGLTTKGPPTLLRFISQVTTRFGVVVSDKAVAQALPLVGAAGGGLINLLFMLQFQRIARGHFIIRRLEQRYGEELVRQQYALV